ncbi:hypothetical protein NQ315_012145 [Exocentrus adspersus]|uniref:CUB domain-containing protein n=1 Tax=Exocentrus adspersus TaxID=1586481 RepID=A0AAV8VY70_9CUCU|nr:hypothetical protein NQ315_012145 [Exocentrus adspersus]
MNKANPLLHKLLASIQCPIERLMHHGICGFFLEARCDNQDSLNAFVHTDGRMEKIDSFCGNTLPKPVMSNGPRLKLEFQSLIASRYSRGFKATYSFTENFGIRTGRQVPEYPCAFEFSSNESRNGYFHSPNYPGFYPRDTECHYFFHGHLKEKVHLHFNYFDVEGVLPCEATSASDYVEFSNFMARDRKYSRHCGQLKEFDIESDRKFFRVTFRSNDRLDGTGFNATYHFMDEIETYTGRPLEASKGSQTMQCKYPFIDSGTHPHHIVWKMILFRTRLQLFEQCEAEFEQAVSAEKTPSTCVRNNVFSTGVKKIDIRKINILIEQQQLYKKIGQRFFYGHEEKNEKECLRNIYEEL